MGKKSRRKERQQQAANEVAAGIPSSFNGSNKTIWVQAAIIFLFGFLLYANTINHEYAVDDMLVIIKNKLTQQGADGIDEIMTTDAFYGFFGEDYKFVAGGRYRPLSIVTFALEIEFFGPDKPHISHLINVVLYGLTCVVLFFTLMQLFVTEKLQKFSLTLPFIITLLYVAHPLHTEAVANIKGRDEIMGMLGALLTLWCALLYVKKENVLYLLLAAVAYIFGLLSKENVITYLAIIPLSFYFFTSAKLKHYITVTVPLLIVAGVYVMLRSKFTDVELTAESQEILNNPFVFASTSERMATVAFTFWEYLRLLVVPHPLTHDYYFNQVPVINWANAKAILPFFLNLGILAFAIWKLPKKNIFSYGILYYFITLSIVSNILFTVGIAMNERFLFMPSLGYCIILGVLLVRLSNYIKEKNFTLSGIRHPKMAGILLLVVLAAYSVKTVARNQAWKNDFTIFSTDAENSPNSAKVHNAYGGELLAAADRATDAAEKDRYLKMAEEQQKKALEIYPTYVNALLIMGNVRYKLTNKIDEAMQYYKRVLEIRPGYYEGNFNAGSVLLEDGKPEQAIPYLRQATITKPDRHEAFYNLGEAYFKAGQGDKAIAAFTEVARLRPDLANAYYKIGATYGRVKNDLDNSIKYLRKALEMDPSNVVYYEDLSVAYGLKGDYQSAIQILEQGIKVNPNYSKFYINLSVTYRQMGDIEAAESYLQKARELDPSM